MDVQLPDGTMVKGIPDGMSKADLTAKLAANGYDMSKLGGAPAPAPAAPAAEPAPPPPPSFMDKVGSAVDKIGKTYVTDPLIGMAKGARDTIEGLDKEVLTGPASGIPSGTPAAAQMAQDAQFKSPESTTLDQMYKQAGPTAGIGKFVQEAAMVPAIGPEAKVGATIAGKLLPRALAGASSGAAGGYVLPPGAGETRAGNAVKAGLIGAVAGPAFGTAGDAALAAKTWATESPASRALREFVKGGVDPAAVSAELENPRNLPMTTAAASGSDNLAGFEKSLRRDPLNDPSRYSQADDATNAAAWKQLQDVTDNSVTALPGRRMAQQDAMTGIQEQLDKTGLKQGDRDAAELMLEQLRSGNATKSKFIAKGDQKALNDAIVEATSPNATLGSLLRLHSNLNDPSLYNFTTPGNAQLVRDRVLSLIDSRSNGMGTQAVNQYKATIQPLAESESANKIVSAFQDPISGLPKGAAPTSIPQVTATKLRGAVSTAGKDADNVNLMNPDDRAAIEQLIQDKTKAELVTGGHQIPAELPYAGGVGVPTTKMQAMRSAVNKVLDYRSRNTRMAMDTAAMTPEGWNSVVNQAAGDKVISARDAAMLADILRGVGPISGATAATGGRNAP
jgi:hypothetical protein